MKKTKKEQISDEIKKQFSAFGKKGGLVNKKKGSAYFSEIGKKGIKRRWAIYKLLKENKESK